MKPSVRDRLVVSGFQLLYASVMGAVVAPTIPALEGYVAAALTYIMFPLGSFGLSLIVASHVSSGDGHQRPGIRHAGDDQVNSLCETPAKYHPERA